MLLRVGERLAILMVLPDQGNLTTIRIVTKLREDLSFTDDEHEAYGIEVLETGGVQWSMAADVGREYDFGATTTAVIVGALRKASEAGKLTPQHLSVCDKFGLE